MALIDKEVAEEKVIDIDLSSIRKKRFRINGDDNKILELNVSDMNIFTRLNEVYPKLDELINEALTGLSDDTSDDEKALNKTAATLKSIDTKMKEYIDYIFDSNVSELCAGTGSMYDPLNGKFRYEHIIETIAALYENNLTDEVNKLQKRISKHTGKYTKKK